MGLLQLRTGDVFAGDYRIERPLGGGGMGTLYVVEQLSTGNRRALKLMHPELVSDPTLRQRFEREARVGARIKSDHVVQVLAAGVDEPTGVPWLVMELLEGEDLAAAIGRRGRLDHGEMSEIFAQLGHALCAAHAVGVVHRDLKPENIFLADSRNERLPFMVKVLDYGIAKVVAEVNTGQTAAIGTLLWMAPEQTVVGGVIGPQTDVWALGLIVYSALTGRCYWKSGNAKGGSPAMIMREVVIDALPAASARATADGCAELLPEGFDAWFERCVAREPEKRFAEAGAARDALLPLLTGRSGVAPGPNADRAAVSATPRSDAALALTAAAPQLAEGAATAAIPEAAPNEASAPAATVPAAVSTSSVSSAAGKTAAAPVARPAVSRARLAGVAAVLMAAAALWWRSGGLADTQVPAPAPIASLTASTSTTASARSSSSGDPSKSPAPVMAGPIDQEDSTTVWKIPIGDSPSAPAAAAPVTIVEFANFQCPITRATAPMLRSMRAMYGDKVRIVWKDDPLAIHARSAAASTVAREALAQKGPAAFWAAHDELIELKKLDDESLLGVARKLDLDLPRTQAALRDKKYQSTMDGDIDLGNEFQVLGTPTLFVNGRRLIVPTEAKLKAIVDEELAKAKALDAGGARPDPYADLTAGGRSAPVSPMVSLTLSNANALPRGNGPTDGIYLYEFGSFTDFLCRRMAGPIDALLKRYDGQLLLVWKDLPMKTDENAMRAALASHAVINAAGATELWRMHDRLFAEAPGDEAFSLATLTSHAVAVGIKASEFKAAMRDPARLAEVQQDISDAERAGITGVPSFVITRPGALTGHYLAGPQPMRTFEKVIDTLLRAQGKTPAPARSP